MMITRDAMHVATMHRKLSCRSPNVERKTLLMIVDGCTEPSHEGSFKIRAMSFNACGRATFSAETHAPYIATASVAAPVCIPKPDARSMGHCIRLPHRPQDRHHECKRPLSPF